MSVCLSHIIENVCSALSSAICMREIYDVFWLDVVASVEHPWERAVAGNKVPYYIK